MSWQHIFERFKRFKRIHTSHSEVETKIENKAQNKNYLWLLRFWPQKHSTQLSSLPPQMVWLSFHGKALGPSRLAWMHLILWPFTISSSFSPILTSKHSKVETFCVVVLELMTPTIHVRIEHKSFQQSQALDVMLELAVDGVIPRGWDMFWSFPTCQVRVVRFYVCSPLPRPHPPSSHPPPCSSPTSSPSSSPDCNMGLQIAVGSAGPQ